MNTPLKIKDKVLAYIIRTNSKTPELLVFEEKGSLHLSPQVPAGGIETQEPHAQAVIREVFEESGVKLVKSGTYLGQYEHQRQDVNHLHKRHVYCFVKNDLPDHWSHIVTGGGDDDGLIFDYYWLPMSQAKNTLSANMGHYCDHPKIKALLET